MGRRVKRTRNLETWTEAQFWSMIRSALRQATRYWRPAQQCKANSRRKYKGKNKRQKYEYQCKACGEWFKDKEVQIDHIVPAGSLRCWEDLVPFTQRLTCEDVNGYQLLCKKCHQIKTNNEKKNK